MKAAVVRRYGAPEVVECVEMPVPEPKAGELLVRVTAVAVTAGDNRLRSGKFPRGFGTVAKLGVGLFGPRKPVLGIVYAGVVERVGDGVAEFAPGDEVAGVNSKTFGMHAEYATVPVSRATRIYEGVTPVQAAGVLFGGTAALYFLRDRAKVKPGQTVLVNGASGAVGSAAVQLARHFGARVTAVTSGRNADLVKRIGAESVVNYENTSLESLSQRFDVVFDAVGNIGVAGGRRLAADRGTVILAAADLLDTVRARGRIVAGVAPENPEDFETLMQLVAEGHLDPLVTSLGSLDEIVEAHRIADSGRKVGSVVVQPTA